MRSRLAGHQALLKLEALIKGAGYLLRVRDAVDSGHSYQALFVEKSRSIILFLADSDGRAFAPEQLCFNLAHEVRHMQHVTQGLYPGYYPGAKGGAVQAYDERRGHKKTRSRLGSKSTTATAKAKDKSPARPKAPDQQSPGRLAPLTAVGPCETLVREALTPAVDALVGLRAENDCNRWAVAFLSKEMPLADGGHYQVPAYPFEGVDGYLDYQAIRSDRRGGRTRKFLALAKAVDINLHTQGPGQEAGRSSDAARAGYCQNMTVSGELGLPGHDAQERDKLLKRLDALADSIPPAAASRLAAVAPAIRRLILGCTP